jgi:hypothetical protein
VMGQFVGCSAAVLNLVQNPVYCGIHRNTAAVWFCEQNGSFACRTC